MNTSKSLLITLVLLAMSQLMFAQYAPGLPRSFSVKQTLESDKILLAPPLIEKNFVDANKNGFYEIGKTIAVDLSYHNSGGRNLVMGTEIWLLDIKSTGAQGLVLYFSDFQLPKGARLFVYSKDKSELLGAYTHESNLKRKEYAIGLVHGDELTIEYNAPEGVKAPNINLSEVSYLYRDVEKVDNKKWTDPSDYCEVNINCVEGTNWQEEKRGVARILTKDNGSSGWCTGSLINNSREDGAPYFITAYHCGPTASEADFNQWIFAFNYEAEGCANPSVEPSKNVLIGAEFRSKGSIQGGSDFFLVELNELVPYDWSLYYNGWDASGEAATSGVGIHHPSGGLKKISTYTTTLSSATPTISQNVMATNAAWKVNWVSTTTNHGVTEGGSSGSPVFNQNHHIVGTLSGGAASCSSPTSPDYYGKLSYHWDDNGAAPYQQLKFWLDADNQGISQMNGFKMNQPMLPGVSNFKASIDGQNVTLSWEKPKANASGWYAYTSLNDCEYIIGSYQIRGVAVSAKAFELIYPMQVSKISHGFAQGTNSAWTNDKFSFVIYDSDFSTILFESEELTAVSGQEYVYTLSEPMVFSNDFVVAIKTVDADGTPSTLMEVVGSGQGHSWVKDEEDWLYAQYQEEGYEFLSSIYVIGEDGKEKSIRLTGNKTTKDVKPIEKTNFSIRKGQKIEEKANVLKSYELYRNGELLSDNLDAETLSFEDTGLELSKYTYYIKAVYEPEGISKAVNVWVDLENVGQEQLDAEKEEWNIYPNPVSKNLNVFISNDYLGELKLQIVNLSGQVVYSESVLKIQTSFEKNISIDLAEGLYLVQVLGGKKPFQKKLIIQH